MWRKRWRGAGEEIRGIRKELDRINRIYWMKAGRKRRDGESKSFLSLSC
jgi:hypothetical protein